MRRFFAIFLRFFLQGVVIIGPLAVTVYAIFFVFSAVDNLIPWVREIAPGIGFVSIVLLITLVGYIGTRFFIFRWIFEAFGNILEHTPGIKYVYSSVKDVFNSFMGDKKKFNNPVWVRTHADPDVWRIGFLTQQELSNLGEPDMAAVYLPHSYAISGWVIVVNRKDIKPVVGMNAAEAMKFAVSGGVTGMHDTTLNSNHL